MSLILLIALVSWPVQPPRVAAAVAPLQDDARTLDGTGLAFELNVGQADPAVRYLARGSGSMLFFTPSEVVLALPNSRTAPAGAVVRVRFEGANPEHELIATGKLPGVVNYLRGSDSSRWHTGLPTYAAIQYTELYPGVALGYQAGAGSLKGTYTLAPGVDPAVIRWRYEGVEDVRVDRQSGDLQIRLGGTEKLGLTEQAPAAWQIRSGRRVPVSAAYTVADDGTVGLALGPYDRRLSLTIDPELRYSTYLGGDSYDEGRAIAVDGEGNAYVAGWTYSTNFPTSSALQASPPGRHDAFVVKLNPQGNTRLFATYLGGVWDDEANSIAVDSLGNVIVAGRTNSADWPLAGAIQGTRLSANGVGFLAKLTPMGNGFIFSTYLGGIGGAEVRGVTAGADGSIYVTGFAYSGFPLFAPFEPRSRGGDAFVAKLDPAGSRFLYSTYLGGANLDDGYGIAVDRSGNAFVTGFTMSPDLPVVSPYQSQCRPVPSATNCSTDAFVSALSADGSHLLYSTYLGSSETDRGHSIALDEEGNIALTGYTNGTDFPVVNAAQPTYGGAQSDAFVTKLSGATGQPVFSTYLGGNNVEYGTQEAVAVDPEGRIVVVGSTSSGNFPLLNPIYDLLRPGNTNAFVTQYSPAGEMLFSSYLGSDDMAGAAGVAVDLAGNAYVTGYTRADDFPTVNPVQPTFGGGVDDAFATKIHIGPGVALRFSPPQLTFEKRDSGTTSPPQTVQVTNVSPAGVSLASVSLAGANPLDFAIGANTCSFGLLPSSGSCLIAVTFTPRGSGMRSAAIAIEGPGWTRRIPLSGFGAPTAELTPGNLEFPLTKPNWKSEQLAETLRNVGQEPLTLGLVTIAGLDAARFSIESDECSNATIGAGGTCDVKVSFTPAQIGQSFGKLVFNSPVFDAPVTASLAGTGGTTPVLTVERSEWGVCEGLVVRVHGSNYPPSGKYQVSFDNTPLLPVPGTTGSDGSFSTLVTIPQADGGTHVISASDTILTTYRAEVSVRTPGTDLPVILIPGVSGSYIDAASEFTYVAPSDPQLAIPWPDETQLIPQLFHFRPGDHIWLDGYGVVAIIGGEYRLLDVLRLQTDGLTPEPGWFGTTSDLRVGEVLWNVDIAVKNQDFYRSMRDFLRNMTNPDGSKRYSDAPGEGRNLYYFPYDWRKDVALTGGALDAMIDEARRTSHKDKVILLVHSMGGLVARNYLLQYGTSKVDQFISMATPYLGSPLVGKVLEAGDNWGIQLNILAGLGPGLHPAEAKKIAQNFTSSYELLPAAGYFGSNPWEQVFDTQYVRQQSSINGQLVMEPLNYAQSVQFFRDRHNPGLSDLAETFRQRGMGDFSLLRGQLFHQRIMGINLDTIGGIVLSPRQVCADTWFGRVCVPLPEFVDVRLVLGDGSVPLHSALGTGWQNDKGFGDDERTYLVDKVSHCDVPGDPRVQNIVERMIRGQLCRTTNLAMPTSANGPERVAAVGPTPLSGVSGVQIVAAGTATLGVTDDQGRHTGAIDGVRYGADQEIPGSHYAMTPGGQSIALSGDGPYTLTLRGMNAGGAVSLRVDTLSNGAVTESRIFESIPVTATTVANVSLTLPGPVLGAKLKYKYDDNEPEREAGQLPPLTGAAAEDRLPPVTQIAVSADRQVTLTATDTGGSGVRRILYSTDRGAHYQVYTAPFPRTTCVKAVAEDWAGNAEYPAAELPCVNLYLPLLRR